jgi:hypothetical protein
MDSHEREELSDEFLAQEIEAAFDVEPSPEFRARIRTRIASERIDESWTWLSGWRWAGAAMAAAAVVMLGLWIARDPALAPPDEPSVVALHDAEPAQGNPGIEVSGNRETQIPKPESASGSIALSNVPKAVVQARAVHVPDPPVAQAELLISQDEAAALRRLFTAISNGRFDTAALPDLDAALQPPSEIAEIVLEPIRLSPLVSLESE